MPTAKNPSLQVAARRHTGRPVTKKIQQARSSFAGNRAVLAARLPARQVASSFCVRAFLREWPDPEFIKETEELFPDEGIANVEQARALFSSLGYTYLDVRPALEYEEVGRVKGSVNIPIKISKRVWNSEQKKKVIEKSDNENFVEQVKKRFPDTETPLLIGCSDGRTYSIDALMALDEAGYTNMVGLKGGYYAWFRVFDNKLGRRRTGEYAETYTHDGDSCGIHSSGAGFDRVDKADMWIPPNY
ncbi:hypothetical protein WJX72_005336 [[Myrmecia] bisecta]|uniref:Rhodanese domain-containing protein n=1 Tax=[Myrmecia] bisecta TaxID=41462 RepID=A0AAW1Q7F4_9CHLO